MTRHWAVLRDGDMVAKCGAALPQPYTSLDASVFREACSCQRCITDVVALPDEQLPIPMVRRRALRLGF